MRGAACFVTMAGCAAGVHGAAAAAECGFNVCLVGHWDAPGTAFADVWQDESYTGGPISKVLVIAVANDERNRRIFEDSFARAFREKGVEGITVVESASLCSELHWQSSALPVAPQRCRNRSASGGRQPSGNGGSIRSRGRCQTPPFVNSGDATSAPCWIRKTGGLTAPARHFFCNHGENSTN